MNLRFFSERVFGVWVDGTVDRVIRSKETGRPSRLVITAEHNGHRWREKVPVTREFYYPHSHPLKGEAFSLEEFN